MQTNRKRKRVVSFLMMAAMLNIIVGCGSDLPVSSDVWAEQFAETEPINHTQVVSAGKNNPMVPAIPELFPQTFKLETGNLVTVQALAVTDFGLELDISYINPETNKNALRHLVASSILNSFCLSDQTDRVLFGFSMFFNPNSNIATTKIWTFQDEFTITCEVSTGQTTYSLNAGESVVNFASPAEIQQALSIYESWTITSSEQLSASDLALYNRAANLVELFETPISFYQNQENELAAQLFGDPTFRSWLEENSPVQAVNRQFLCGAASLIAIVSCPWFMAGLPALICAPATGIAAACGVADIVEAW